VPGSAAAFTLAQIGDLSNAPEWHPGNHQQKTNEQEMRAAAQYFASVNPKPWIRVVDTATVAKTHVAGWREANGRSASKGADCLP
jgi:hypothetical protein